MQRRLNFDMLRSVVLRRGDAYETASRGPELGLSNGALILKLSEVGVVWVKTSYLRDPTCASDESVVRV